MKSILITMLAKFGVTLNDEQTAELGTAISDNFVAKADHEAEIKKHTDTIIQHEVAIGNLNKQLKGFDGIDVSTLQNTISTLNNELTATRKNYATEKQIKEFEVEKEGVKYKINNPATFSRLIGG